MLANAANIPPHIGILDREIHKPAEFLRALIDFVASELPGWRDRPERRPETAETTLTSQVCAHLNSAARHSAGWDILQFRVEERDEVHASRKIDLVAAPSGATITIEGRSHVDFDCLMPIECKRLPTPAGNDREEREYVFTTNGTTGGIQRFKGGLHGAAHNIAAMIAYVQEGSTAAWSVRITEWIGQLADAVPGWTTNDLLEVQSADPSLRMSRLTSSHERPNGLKPIELHHLWLEMH